GGHERSPRRGQEDGDRLPPARFRQGGRGGGRGSRGGCRGRALGRSGVRRCPRPRLPGLPRIARRQGGRYSGGRDGRARASRPRSHRRPFRRGRRLEALRLARLARGDLRPAVFGPPLPAARLDGGGGQLARRRGGGPGSPRLLEAPGEPPPPARGRGAAPRGPAPAGDGGDFRVSRLTILGAGSWGTALAVHFARAGRHEVILWARHEALARRMAKERANPDYLPGVELPPGLHPTSDLAAGLGSELTLVVVPSHGFRDVL